MKKTSRIILSVILCAVMALMPLSGALAAKKNKYQSLNKSQIEQKIAQYQAENKKLAGEIAELKKEQNQQSAVLGALQKKIGNIQAIINTYNAEINRINGIITDNKSKISSMEADIEQDKLDYKKRIRAIYMSEWDSQLKVLLDANSFAEFLQLQKLTEAISAKDKKFMESLSAEIEELNAINEENRVLLEKQVELKSAVKKQQDELKSQENEAAAVYNEISKDLTQTKNEVSENNAEIAELEKAKKEIENSVARKANLGESFINPNTGFMWPVAGYYTISSPFGPRGSGYHNGMDIAGAGIQGRPILAIADGVVSTAVNSWSGGKSGYASYGNYCSVDHGRMTVGGVESRYVAFYAHATSIVVSAGQQVKQGQVLGYVGTTGNSTGYHLHLGVQRNGSWINPRSLF
ncbi:MAG: peptidoglycan DD-metalloendopeptidase family protein [Clostridia bacterium]|nr:peptidoglycan DD-metalloendopeptidase family protein [Clostridia bacterium]